MRHFLAVAFLAATLAFGGSAAFAYGDKVDYAPSSQPAAARTGSPESLVAGGSTITATSVYNQLREENKER